MVPTLKLRDIVVKWRDALQASSAIQSYCTTKYSKSPKIYVGVNGKSLPSDTDCPVIIIYPGMKSEGLELQEYVYTMAVGWTILQSATSTSGNITEYTGTTECDDLGQLIYLEFAQLSANYPVSEVKYNIEPVAYYPRFPGRMDITVKIKPVNGYSISY